MADHDLLETNTRIRRLLVAVTAAVVVAGLAAVALWLVINPEQSTKAGDWRFGAWNAYFYLVALAGGVTFVGTLILLKHRDDRRWFAPPKAKLRDAR